MAWDTSTDCSGARIATGVTPTHCGYIATRRRQEDLKQTLRDTERRGSAPFTPFTPCSGTARHGAMCSKAARAVGSALWLLPFGPPCAAVRGGRSGPAEGIGKEADSFSSGQEPRRKARPPLTNWLGEAQTAPSGVLFLLALPPSRWLLFFTPGILPSALRAGFAVRTRSCACVGKQRKVTRPPAGGRKPAAGEPDP